MSVECPHCGLTQQPKIATRPVGADYETETMGIYDDPRGTDFRFVAFEVSATIYWVDDFWAIAQCLDGECQTPFLLSKNLASNDWRAVITVPGASVDYLGDDTPEAVKSAIQQARKCLAIDCNDAAAAMCRAALERMAKDKEAKGGTLAAKLKDLKDRDLLTGLVYDASTELKEWGNTALHDLLSEPVELAVAEQLIVLADLVVKDLYVTPATIRDLKDKRQ